MKRSMQLGKTVPFLASSATAVVAILIFMSLQTWSAPEKDVSQLRCISNLRMIAIGLAMYADDHNGRIPRQSRGARLGESLFPRRGEICIPLPR